MSRTLLLACCLVGGLLLADVAAAAAAGQGAAGAAAAARRLQQHSGRHSRKLMQPFSLGIQDSGDRTGRANQREIDRLARDSVEFALIPREQHRVLKHAFSAPYCYRRNQGHALQS
jgi:hypothetical protein